MYRAGLQVGVDGVAVDGRVPVSSRGSRAASASPGSCGGVTESSSGGASRTAALLQEHQSRPPPCPPLPLLTTTTALVIVSSSAPHRHRHRRLHRHQSSFPSAPSSPSPCPSSSRHVTNGDKICSHAPRLRGLTWPSPCTRTAPNSTHAPRCLWHTLRHQAKHCGHAPGGLLPRCHYDFVFLLASSSHPDRVCDGRATLAVKNKFTAQTRSNISPRPSIAWRRLLRPQCRALPGLILQSFANNTFFATLSFPPRPESSQVVDSATNYSVVVVVIITVVAVSACARYCLDSLPKCVVAYLHPNPRSHRRASSACTAKCSCWLSQRTVKRRCAGPPPASLLAARQNNPGLD